MRKRVHGAWVQVTVSTRTPLPFELQDVYSSLHDREEQVPHVHTILHIHEVVCMYVLTICRCLPVSELRARSFDLARIPRTRPG